MRSTCEIICAVKECKPVTEDELKMALLVLNSTEHFLKRHVQHLCEDKGPAIRNFHVHNAREFVEKSLFTAHKADPLLWLGPGNIPGNPEHDRMYAMGCKLIDKILAQNPQIYPAPGAPNHA